MEAFFALIIAVVAVIGFDLAAIRWGADSRPGMVDDHQR
jgi:hypothetical protein